jgi:hypothetical protein
VKRGKTVFAAAEWDLPTAAILLALAFIYAIWMASIGWDNTLNDHHSFRQTQTAITAYYMKKDGFRLDYETPVLGKPWSLPMEFPLYQWVVATVSSDFNAPLDQTGRFVAFTSFLLIPIPLYFLLLRFGVALPHRLAMLVIFVTSPFYLFWSRAFLIESTALLFSFAYVACLSFVPESKSRWLGALTVLFGIAASLTKITTWLPFLAWAGLMITWDWWRWPIRMPGKAEFYRGARSVSVYCGIPFLIAVWWVKYSDRLKQVHPFAYTITAANSAEWNFGTLHQKLSWDVWTVIIGRACMVLGMPLPVWSLFFLCAVAVGVTRRRWKEACACLAMFLLSPVVFTNLQFIHDYYMNANGVFLLGFFGFGVVALLEQQRTNMMGWALLGAILMTAIMGYVDIFLPAQEQQNGEIRDVADYVKAHTSEDSVIICIGFDWSSLVPYYCERRALMIPDWKTLTPGEVDRALQSLRGCKVEALLEAESHRYPLDELKKQIAAAGFAPKEIKVNGLPLR